MRLSQSCHHPFARPSVSLLLPPPSSQFFTIKMSEGIVATSYSSGDKFYIDPMKLLPLERFLPRPKGAAPARGGEGVVDPWAASSG